MGPAQRVPLCRNCPLLACGSRLSRPGPLCLVTLPPSTRPAGPGAKTTPTVPLWPGLPITGYLGVPHAQCWFGGAEGGPTEHRTSPRTGADEPRQMPPRFPAGTRSCGCSPPAGGTVPHSTLTGTGHGASGRLRAGPGDVCASTGGAGGAAPGRRVGAPHSQPGWARAQPGRALAGPRATPARPHPAEPRPPPHPHCCFSSGRHRQRSFVAAKRAGAIVLEELQEGTVGDGLWKKVEENRGKSYEGRRNLLLLSPVPPFPGRA